MTTYYAILEKDEGTAYGVSFPDFPGCIAVADTYDEAVRYGADALRAHIQAMVERNLPIPPPSAPDTIKSFKRSMIVPIEVDG